MPAGNITLKDKWATIECDDTEHTITLQGAGGYLVNIGSNPVFVSMNEKPTAVYADGAQHEGELELGPSDSVPLPANPALIRHICGAGLVTKLWFIPLAS